MADEYNTRLSSYLDGELTAAERAQIEAELRESPEMQRALDDLARVRDWATSYRGRMPEDDPWDAIVAQLDGEAGDARRSRARFWEAIAAGLAAIGGNTVRGAFVTGLVGVSLLGMGRQVWLERENRELVRAADDLQTKVVALDNMMTLTETDPWLMDARDFRGQFGAVIAVNCPGLGGSAEGIALAEEYHHSTVWGSGVYTDDSPICLAAVHSGLINMRDGGAVHVLIEPGREHYAGSPANGIVSSDYGSWGGSYTFESLAPELSNVVSLSWTSDASSLRDQVGVEYRFRCPPNGELDIVWGSGVYTDDSSVCSAAVHAGLITLANGGEVTVEMRDGEDRYISTSRNGVTTSSFGSWGGSFVFTTDDGTTDTFDYGPTVADWDDSVTRYRQFNGTVLEFSCPAGGELHSVWGVDVYTDDSSVCSAAVFEGLIDLEDGGEVRVRILEGRDVYGSGIANGVETRTFGSWSGSFEFVN